MAGSKLLVYLLRRDLRVSDNPIFHHLATTKDHGFTHVLPIYVFPHHQIEIGGLLKDGEQSPYPQALSQVAGFWRCGSHRAKFIAQSVWDVKKTLESLGSTLVIRAGKTADVLDNVIKSLGEQGQQVSDVWMTAEKSSEEIKEEEEVNAVCKKNGADFKLWADEKYFVDDRDTGLEKPSDLPDVFTSYRKNQEPLRERPRPVLRLPEKGALPGVPESIPPQSHPFVEATGLDDLEQRLLSPLSSMLSEPPAYPEGAESAHPLKGGETNAHDRLRYLITSGGMTSYKETRNGLVGLDFSTKLSAYLSLGCISARQVHKELKDLEDGTNADYASANGYGEGENEGTKGVRFELLWRDYMRLCTRKFGSRLFRLSGFRQDQSYNKKWKSPRKNAARQDQSPAPEEVNRVLQRFLEGTTGQGLIDASQRELFHTGYTSNRARQNVASFLAKHMSIDWRYGAEWYEMHLVDYDVSSNWSNWQYVAGIGNDPRGDARIFNPVKQAFDYDKEGEYVKTWVPEVRDLESLENIFQPCTAKQADLERIGLAEHKMVTDPIKRIDFTLDRKPKGPRKSFPRKRGQGRGGRGGGSPGQGSDGSNSGGNGGNAKVQQNGRPGGNNGNGHQQGAFRGRGQRFQYNTHTPNGGYSYPPNHNGYGAPMYPQQQQQYPEVWYGNGFNMRGRGSNGYRGRGGRRGNAGYNQPHGYEYGGYEQPAYYPQQQHMGPVV